jgi:hypothetical protein
MDVARILLDQFPAIAYSPTGGKYEPARVVVVNDRVQIWVIRNGTSDPEIAYEADALSMEGNLIAGFDVLTPDGTVKSIRAGGCGCGNKLKSFDPYGGATRTVERR